MVHERRKDWDAARKTYEDLLKIDDGSLIGLNNLAYLLSDKLNQPRLALPYAERASVIHRLPVVRDTLAWTLVQLGEYRKAIAVLTRLLEEDPRYVPAMYHLGEAYRRMTLRCQAPGGIGQTKGHPWDRHRTNSISREEIARQSS